MTQLLLIRHASTDWVGRGLAGRLPGVGLNPQGSAEAQDLAERLADLDLTALYASPMQRTLETAAYVAEKHELPVEPLPGVNEVDFGAWTGRELADLRQEPLWATVQQTPSRMRFPDGEALLDVQARAVGAIEEVLGRHPGGLVAVVTHADVIKLLVNAYAGAGLDSYQRLDISPASVCLLSFEGDRPQIHLVNHCGAIRAAAPKPKPELAATETPHG